MQYHERQRRVDQAPKRSGGGGREWQPDRAQFHYGTEYNETGSGNLQPGGWIGGEVHHNTIIDVDAGAAGEYGIKPYNGGQMQGTRFYNNIQVSETANVWGAPPDIAYSYRLC